jgi:hypothetical protein
MPLSAISWRPVLVVEEPEYPERTTDHGQATGKLYHLRLPVECTLFVIYMNLIMLGNPTTQLIDPPGPGSYGTVVVKLNIWQKKSIEMAQEYTEPWNMLN